MEYRKIKWEEIGATAELTSFLSSGGVDEFHAILHIEPRGELFAGQLCRISSARKRLLELPELEGVSCVLVRYFLSDASNQAPLIKEDAKCSVSIIQQPPLDGSKIAVWLYMQRGMTVTSEDSLTVCTHNGYSHLWMTGMAETEGNSYQQTETLLDKYSSMLGGNAATLAENCVRTWFFVRDVDTQYEGMVKARKKHFAGNGLTETTHYIASTGIGGVPTERQSIVMLDTYAVKGIAPGQQRYLYAPTHLNPTYEYGVTFERGTVVEYGDRSHVFISGTASIDNKGKVLHEGDVVKQALRMWENVETLLGEAGSSFDDVMQIIVYLRDIADYPAVEEMFSRKFPAIPYVITLAPVCRPSWLIEMECMAVTAKGNKAYADY